MDALLALDQGTSSSRALVFDRAGRLLASAQRELPQHFPQPGWVEHDAAQIWADQLACAREAVAKAGGLKRGFVIPEKYVNPSTSGLSDTVDSEHSGFKRLELKS